MWIHGLWCGHIELETRYEYIAEKLGARRDAVDSALSARVEEAMRSVAMRPGGGANSPATR